MISSTFSAFSCASPLILRDAENSIHSILGYCITSYCHRLEQNVILIDEIGEVVELFVVVGSPIGSDLALHFDALGFPCSEEREQCGLACARGAHNGKHFPSLRVP